MRLMNPVRHRARVLLRPEPVDGVGEGDGRGGARPSPAGGEGQPVLELERDGRRARSSKRWTSTACCATASTSATSRRSTSPRRWRWPSASDPEAPERRGPGDRTWEREELERLKRKEARGVDRERDAARRLGAPAALRPTARASPIDERPFNMVRRMIDELKPETVPSLDGAEGGGQAAGVRAGAGRGAGDRRAARSWRPRWRHAAAGLRRARAVMSARGELTPAAERALPQGARSLDAREGASTGRSRSVEGCGLSPREVPAPDRCGEGAAAGGDGGRPPVHANSLAAAVDAAKLGLIRPILVGPRAKIEAVAERARSSTSRGLRAGRRAAQPRRRRRRPCAGRAGQGRGADEGQPPHRRADGRGGQARRRACAPPGASATASSWTCPAIRTR